MTVIGDERWPFHAMGSNENTKMMETSFSPSFNGEYQGMMLNHTKDEDKDDSSEGCGKGWMQAFKSFTQDTTLHGVRYICMSDTFGIRRFLWLLFLLAGTGIMSFQIVDRIITYYDWPVTVNVEVNFNKSLSFPAVTICNQNSFRATSAANHSRYRLIEELYSGETDSIDLDKYNAWNISLEDLFLTSAHRKQDLIVQWFNVNRSLTWVNPTLVSCERVTNIHLSGKLCLWDGTPCSADNFTLVQTDHGICYTFNSDRAPLEVNSAGSENGLHLTLNIEQYEYMPGPHGAAGVKIFMHDKDDTPLVGELGFAIPAGTHSFVGNSLLVIDNLPPKYGECGERKLDYFDLYTSANCKLDCLTGFLEKSCGCRDFFMPDIQGYPPVCTLEQKYGCMIPALRKFNADDVSVCGPCHVPCLYQVYQPVLSYATVSNFVIDKLLANVDSDQIGQNFMAAKEITHRMENNKFQRYKRLVDNVIGKFKEVERLLVEDIPKKFEYLEEKMSKHRSDIMEVWTRKLYIYEYQEHMVVKNFLRGRDAMEEQTLAQIANGFQASSLDIERKIDTLANPSINDSVTRFLIYELLTDKLKVESEMIRRATDNITALIDSFRNGTPIFRYKFRGNPKSLNPYAVPKVLLASALNRTWNARNYGLRTASDLGIYQETVKNYTRLIRQVYETGKYNATDVRWATRRYFKYSKRYFHNRANLYFESIEWARDEITRRKERFANMKIVLDKIFTNMENNIASLKESLSLVRGTIISNLAYGCNMANEYLTNTSVSKLEVSKALTDPDIHEGINTMKVFLQEVRSRGQNIFDDWTKLIDAFSNIWKDVLNDTDSFEYYRHKNMSDFTRDMHGVLWRLELSLVGAREYGDLRDVIQNRGRIFLKALYDIMDESDDFKRTTTLDGTFLRDNFVFLNIYYSELSYEQITQQEGYGLFPLLCDIGGSMGLFIGASALTLFEIVDLFVNQTFVEMFRPRKKKDIKPMKV